MLSRLSKVFWPKNRSNIDLIVIADGTLRTVRSRFDDFISGDKDGYIFFEKQPLPDMNHVYFAI